MNGRIVPLAATWDHAAVFFVALVAITESIEWITLRRMLEHVRSWERKRMETSSSLLERLRDNTDIAAWDRFAELYGPLLHQWLNSYHLQHHDSCDVAQEVLTVVSRKLATFEYDPRRGAFRGWLRTILANQLRAFWRRRKRHPPGIGDVAWQQRLAELEDPNSELSACWDKEYNKSVSDRALRLIQTDFEPSTWQAFWQVVVEGRKPAEVADELGLTRNAVYIAKSRILERLKHELAGLLD